MNPSSCNFLGAIDHVIRVSLPKTEIPIGGLNSSSSKTKRTSEIKLSNLEASGQTVLALKKLILTIPTLFFFFIYLFVYRDFCDALRRKSLCFFPAYFTNS